MQICVESFPVEIRGQKKKYFEPMQIFKSLSTGFACFRRNKFWRTVKEIFHQARFYTRWRGMGARLAYVTPLFPYRVHRKRHVSLLAPGRCDRSKRHKSEERVVKARRGAVTGLRISFLEVCCHAIVPTRESFESVSFHSQRQFTRNPDYNPSR